MPWKIFQFNTVTFDYMSWCGQSDSERIQPVSDATLHYWYFFLIGSCMEDAGETKLEKIFLSHLLTHFPLKAFSFYTEIYGSCHLEIEQYKEKRTSTDNINYQNTILLTIYISWEALINVKFHKCVNSSNLQHYWTGKFVQISVTHNWKLID